MQRAELNMVCPVCRDERDDCIMELEINSLLPVGFYRKGFMCRIPLNSEVKVYTKCVRILEDGRDLAQAKTIEVWKAMMPKRPT